MSRHAEKFLKTASVDQSHIVQNAVHPHHMDDPVHGMVIIPFSATSIGSTAYNTSGFFGTVTIDTSGCYYTDSQVAPTPYTSYFVINKSGYYRVRCVMNVFNDTADGTDSSSVRTVIGLLAAGSSGQSSSFAVDSNFDEPDTSPTTGGLYGHWHGAGSLVNGAKGTACSIVFDTWANLTANTPIAIGTLHDTVTVDGTWDTVCAGANVRGTVELQYIGLAGVSNAGQG